MIHLGHNRSVEEVVTAAVQEDVQGVAISSYQGGHVEYFRYLVDRLPSRGRAPTSRSTAAGAASSSPRDRRARRPTACARIFSPDDGQRLGLGRHDQHHDRATATATSPRDRPRRSGRRCSDGDQRALARVITCIQAGTLSTPTLPTSCGHAAARRRARCSASPAPGGSGKSSLTDELIRRFRLDQEDKLRIAVLAVDPTRRRGGGALLGDRIRMNAHRRPPRLLPVAWPPAALGRELPDCLADVDRRLRGRPASTWSSSRRRVSARATPPSSTFADVSLYVMTPEFGAPRSSRRSTCSTSPTPWRSTSSTAGAPTTPCATCAGSGARNRELFGPAGRAARCSARSPPGSTTTASPRSTSDLTRAPGRRVCRSDGVLARRDRGARSTHASAIVPPARHALSGRDRRDRARLPPRRTERGRGAPGAASSCGVAAHRRSTGRRPTPRRSTALAHAEADAELDRGARDCSSEWPATSRAYWPRRDGGRDRSVAPRRDVAVRHPSPPGGAAPLHRPRRAAALAAVREPPRPLPLHGRRVPVQARGRGPGPDVRRRGRRRRGPTAGSTSWPTASLPPACRPPSTRSRSTASTPTSGPTSTARSATPASRSPRSTT